ncbi:hyaluronidase-4-like isoform X3 [Chrysemys picta bellii]|uniref:hyaluronidase-4-like isoform X3 n=1 Tax=Chrysemys picta bellii TaxID=8478 RepID=UPI0032B242CA
MAAKPLCRVEQTAVRPSSGRLLAWSSPAFRLHRCPLHRTVLLLLLLCPELPRGHNLKPSLPPIVTDRPFLVAWNAPTARCWTSYEVPLSVASFSLLANAQEDFTGGNITIFYYDQLGLYPYYLNKTTPPIAINGGCPQNASLLDHLDKMASDIATTMPSASFAGLSVIDWENWRPQWIRNWDKKNVYRTMSAQLVRQRNPHWPDEQVELEAKWEFETAAAKFMVETLKLAQLLRPGGWWGYYLFPECYNYHYWDDFENFTGGCPQVEVQRNNKLLWLWEQSKALYPSIYMEEVLRASPQGKKFVQAKLSEALRVAQLPSVNHSLPVFAYARPFYSYTLKELTQEQDSSMLLLSHASQQLNCPARGISVKPAGLGTDLVHTIGQAAAMGAHGIVLWGGVEYSRNRVIKATRGVTNGCLPQLCKDPEIPDWHLRPLHRQCDHGNQTLQPVCLQQPWPLPSQKDGFGQLPAPGRELLPDPSGQSRPWTTRVRERSPHHPAEGQDETRVHMSLLPGLEGGTLPFPGSQQPALGMGLVHPPGGDVCNMDVGHVTHFCNKLFSM